MATEAIPKHQCKALPLDFTVVELDAGGAGAGPGEGPGEGELEQLYFSYIGPRASQELGVFVRLPIVEPLAQLLVE